MRNSRPILLVEDNSVDAMTVRRALRDLNVPNELIHRRDAEQALQYLTDSTNKKPCVILLDLNMPKMTGIEFLRTAKADESLRRIPVIVLTTSRNEQDKFTTFDLSAAGYVVKPTDYQRFVAALKTIDLYWTLSEFPNTGG